MREIRKNPGLEDQGHLESAQQDHETKNLQYQSQASRLRNKKNLFKRKLIHQNSVTSNVKDVESHSKRLSSIKDRSSKFQCFDKGFGRGTATILHSIKRFRMK